MQQSQEHSINCITCQKKHKTDAIHCTLLHLDLLVETLCQCQDWHSIQPVPVQHGSDL